MKILPCSTKVAFSCHFINWKYIHSVQKSQNIFLTILTRRIFSHLYCRSPAWSQRLCRSRFSDSEMCSFLWSLMVVTTLLDKISSLLCGTLAVWMFEWVLHPHSHGIYYARVTAGIEKGKPQWSWDIFKSENWNLLITWNGTILYWYSGKITQLGWSHFLLYNLKHIHASFRVTE